MSAILLAGLDDRAEVLDLVGDRVAVDWELRAELRGMLIP